MPDPPHLTRTTPNTAQLACVGSGPTAQGPAALERVSLTQVVGEGYRDFWRFTGRYRVVKGGRASKKSKTTALNLIVRMMQTPGANTLVVRKVYRTLKDSCFCELKWAARRLRCERYWSFKESPLEMTYRPTGQKIYFRGLDDPQKITSLTAEHGSLCWMWIEEAYELARESDFQMLDECIRGAVPDEDADGKTPHNWREKGAYGPLYKQITLTFNPWNEHHWLKRRFFDTRSNDILTLTTTYRCNEFLDKADRKLFADMKRRDPRRYKVAGLGGWGIAEGLVYENWRVGEDGLWPFASCRGDLWSPAWPFPPSPAGAGGLGDTGAAGTGDAGAAGTGDAAGAHSAPLQGGSRGVAVFGLDFGYTTDPAALFCGILSNDKLYVFDELYECRLTNRMLYERIAAMGFAKERIRADAAEPKSIEELYQLGLVNIRAARKGPDSVRAGIRFLQGLEIIIHPKCVNFIAEISSYCWDEEGHRPACGPDHLMDAMRYAVEEAAAGSVFTF